MLDAPLALARSCSLNLFFFFSLSFRSPDINLRTVYHPAYRRLRPIKLRPIRNELIIRRTLCVTYRSRVYRISTRNNDRITCERLMRNSMYICMLFIGIARKVHDSLIVFHHFSLPFMSLYLSTHIHIRRNPL